MVQISGQSYLVDIGDGKSIELIKDYDILTNVEPVANPIVLYPPLLRSPPGFEEDKAFITVACNKISDTEDIKKVVTTTTIVTRFDLYGASCRALQFLRENRHSSKIRPYKYSKSNGLNLSEYVDDIKGIAGVEFFKTELQYQKYHELKESLQEELFENDFRQSVEEHVKNIWYKTDETVKGILLSEIEGPTEDTSFMKLEGVLIGGAISGITGTDTSSFPLVLNRANLTFILGASYWV